ncbi:MAG: RNA polymerase sigma factor [Oscillospiraceae bacterium]|nr:RNA polymerase sigma factor [Oscillospiraceae bacterium]
MDGEAFEKLYETYYMRVYSFVLTLARDRSLAEEITQETFFRALAAGNSFRNESSGMTWLCAIARNLFNDELRRRRKTTELPAELAADSVSDMGSRTEDRDLSFRIHTALHALGEPYREVFELRVFGELSFRQIGTIFGKTENWARVTYHRARLKLQERIGEHEI